MPPITVDYLRHLICAHNIALPPKTPFNFSRAIVAKNLPLQQEGFKSLAPGDILASLSKVKKVKNLKRQQHVGSLNLSTQIWEELPPHPSPSHLVFNQSRHIQSPINAPSSNGI